MCSFSASTFARPGLGTGDVKTIRPRSFSEGSYRLPIAPGGAGGGREGNPRSISRGGGSLIVMLVFCCVWFFRFKASVG